MISEITIENFRAYSDPVTVRVRPVTVLIGQNSAGKSTLIKFLQMLRQTLESAEDSFFVTEGSHVQLGAFRDLKNRNTTKRSVDFSIRINTDDIPSLSVLSALMQFGKGTSQDWKSVMSNLAGKDLPASISSASVIDYEVTGSIHYTRAQPRGSHKIKMSANGDSIAVLNTKNIRLAKFLNITEESDRPETAIVNYLKNRALEPVRYEFVSSRHLSPIREESERAIIVASPPKDDVGHRGQFAMPHLRKLLESGKDDAKLVLKHAEAVAGVSNLHFDTTMKGYLGHVKGKNKQTGAECHLADFGFGVSQCIPIFVQGALMHKGQLLMVEQPEAHLHPTAQLNVASFFADLWNQRKVASLIETHSANILLRLRRLVKEGTLNHKDISVAYFHTDDCRVAVKNLDIQPDGSLEKGLPMEFFGADVIEAIEMGA